MGDIRLDLRPVVGTDARVAVVTLDRQHRANAYGTATLVELHDAFDAIAAAGAVRAVVLTGAGRHFSSGADLREEQATSGQRIDEVRRLLERIADLPVPTIAAINGAAAGGGCELAIACDLRYIEPAATIGLPEIRFGGLACVGGTQRLTRLIGTAKSMELHLLGDLIDAAEAHRIGLVNAVVEPGTVLDVAIKVASTIATRSPIAVQVATRLIRGATDVDLAEGLRLEAELTAPINDDLADGLRDAAANDPTYARVTRERDDDGPGGATG